MKNLSGLLTHVLISVSNSYQQNVGIKYEGLLWKKDQEKTPIFADVSSINTRF